MTLIRSTFLFTALLGILLQPLCEIWIVAQFQVKKDFIVKQLCEKRSEKTNTCQGRCYLKKQLAKTKEAEKKAQTSVKSLLEKEYKPHRFAFHFSQPAFREIDGSPHFYYRIEGYTSPVAATFHPPPFIA